jgi:FixJ family two-component response regulator
MTETDTIVFVMDDESIRDALQSFLRSVGLRIETFGSASDVLSIRHIGERAWLRKCRLMEALRAGPSEQLT